MNPTEFANKIRQKYPGAYDSLSDEDLTNRVIAKYPVYKSQVNTTAVVTNKPNPNGAIGAVIDYTAPKLATGEINTVKALNERGKNLVANTIKAGQADQGKPLLDRVLGGIAYGAKKGIETIAGGVGDIFSNMISPFIPQKVKDVYGEETTRAITDIKKIADESPLVKNVITSLATQAKDNPQVADLLGTVLSDTLNISALGAGSAIEQPIKKSLITGTERLIEGVNATRSATGELIANVTNKITPIIEQRAINVAQKTAQQSIDEVNTILNPSGYYSAAEKQMALQKGNVVQKGKSIFAKEVVKPLVTPQTEVIQGLVNEGKVSAKNLPSKNIEALNQEARIAESNINELVNTPAINKPFTQNTINKVFATVENSAKKDLTFVAKSTEERAYQEVLGVAREEIAKQPYNNAGLRTAIKAFNARMERILGNDIYSGASESVGNARLQAAKDMRTNLNNFLADNLESAPIKKNPVLANTKIVNTMPSASEYATGKLQGGDLYRAQLKREAQLLNAKDEIAFRASRTIDKTVLSQYYKKHPTIRRIVYYGSAGLLGSQVLHDFGL